MGFIKDILGGLFAPRDNGIYVYIKINQSDEIVQVRINRGNDISRNDEGHFFVRKLVMGSNSFARAEATIYFDRHYRVTTADIAGGELVSEADYLEQQAALEPDQPS